MPAFFVDDQFHLHPKAEALVDLEALGVQAAGLWVLTGSMVQAKLTDGVVSISAGSRLIGSRPRFVKLARVLVEVGLWHGPGHAGCDGKCDPTPVDCYRYHDWFGRPMNYASSAQIKTRRERTAELKKPEVAEAVKARDWDNRCRYCGVKGTWEDRRSDRGLTFDHVYPGLAAGATNLVVCCRACNRKKAQRTPEQAGMILRPPPPPRSPISPNGLENGSNPEQIPNKSGTEKPNKSRSEKRSPVRARGGVSTGVGSGEGSAPAGSGRGTAGVAAGGPAGSPPPMPPVEGHTGSPWHGWTGPPPPDPDQALCPDHGLDLPCRTCQTEHYATETAGGDR